MAYGRLREAQGVGQMADAGFPAGLSLDQADYAQAAGLGQSPECRSQAAGSSLIERYPGEQRRAVEDREAASRQVFALHLR